MYRRVFISYAKEDIQHSLELYDFLANNNYQPWLDKKKLLPGSNWDFEIRKALKESDFIILMLSAKSVSKRGYIQREFKLALEYWEQKIESDIYIIPLLINNCSVPEKLRKFQWVTISDEHAYDEILQALNAQRTVYLSEISVEDLTDSHYEKSLPLDLPENRKIDTHIRFPQFPANPYFNAEFINGFIQHEVMEAISLYCSALLDDDYIKDVPDCMKEHFYFSADYQINYISNRFLSIILNLSYYLGGAHPNHYVITKNFAFNPARVLSIYDVLNITDLKLFLAESFKDYADDYLKGEGAHLIDSALNVVDYEHGRGIDFLFNQSELTLVTFNLMPHAFKGAANITIPLADTSVKIKVV